MDDMSAFDRQIASEVLRAAGPSEPVDVLAVFTAITTTQSPKWRFQSMFSATKFVVAGAIVALFGGFLLAGVLTQPSEEPMPAAVSSPPSLTTAELLADFVIEEVEPGIVKVVDDGTGRGLLQLDDIADIAIGPEGAVWLHGRTGTLFRLGEAGGHDSLGAQGGGYSDYLAFSPDGTLHTFEGSTVVRVDPETPEPGQATGSGSDGLHAIGPDRSDPRFHGTSIASGPDGDIWASWIRDSEMNPGASSVMRFDGEAWTEHGTPDGLAGVRALGNGAYVCDIAARERDIVWFGVCGAGGAGFGDGALVRFDGTTWTEVEPFAATDRPDLRVSDVQSLALGPGGTLWAMTVTNTDANMRGEGDFSAEWLDDPLRGPVLVHFDGERWTTYPIGDVVPDADPLYLFAASMVVDAMGTLWLGADHSNLQTGASALVSFDGTTATRYPSIAGARSLAVGPGGGVWAANRDGLYVITPEAVVAGESVDANERAPSVESATVDGDATTPDLLPGVDLVTEEVEPGVHRVLSDGVRDLAAIHGVEQFTVFDLVVGHDGGVWRVGPDDEVFSLGDSMTRQWPEEPMLIGDEDIEVAADGTIWFANEWRPQFASPGYRVLSSEGSGWSDTHAMLTASDIEIGPEGSVWAHGEQLVHLLEPDGSSAWPAPGGVGVGYQFFVTDDGTKWVTSATTPAIWRDASDWLNEEAAWQTVLLGFVEEGQSSITAQRTETDVGGDGTLWMHMELDDPAESMLARLDANGWSSWTVDDGAPGVIGSDGWSDGLLVVAPDGSAWFATGGSTDREDMGCSQRVSHFDGEPWTDYLDGHCIHALDVADDGTVWVRAGTARDAADIYAITPGGAAKAD